MKILIVEDNNDFSIMLVAIVIRAIPDSNIICAKTLEDAILHVANVDLVISDFYYPSTGFLGLLPILIEENKQYILNSGDSDVLKIYDDLQIGTLYKCACFIKDMHDLLQSITINSLDKGDFNGSNGRRSSI